MTLKRILLGLLLLVLAAPVRSEPLLPPQLTVHGEALLLVPADQAVLQVGAETAGAQAEAALAENSRIMRDVEQALRSVGLEQGEYSTGRFQVQPRWSQRPHKAEADWRPQIVGYTVSSSFTVKTRKLERLGRLIEAAAGAGANAIGQIAFGLANPRQHRAAAIAEATANALADAAVLAEAAGAELDGLLNLNLDHAAAPPPRPYPLADSAVRMLAAEAAPAIVAPGDIEVRAGVTAVYCIRQR